MNENSKIEKLNNQTNIRMNPLFVFSLIAFGIVVPLIALAVELWLHICASIFFDPISTPAAVIAVALVPLANIFACFVLMKDKTKLLPLTGILNSLALCTAMLYAVAFLPLAPVGLIGAIFYGLGLLCFAPLFSLMATAIARVKLKALLQAQHRRLIPADLCLCALLTISAAMAFSADLTRTCELEIAAHPERLSKCLLLLRAFGDRKTMLRACYGLEDTRFYWASFTGSLVDWIRLAVFKPPASEDRSYMTNDLARELYYRATGKNFNAVPRPKIQPGDRCTFLDDCDYLEYDQDFAGEAVGGVVRGLVLSNSRIGGEFDPNAAVEHLVWTMQFDKKGYESRELRAQIMLPPGAVVSGAWLMIDSQKRHAVFQARHTARQGYEKEARSGQSGLLIATAGPGRVLIQAPSIKKGLELCLQIDAPMKIWQENKVLTTLPCLIERNFELACKTDINLVETMHYRSRTEAQEMGVSDRAPGGDRAALSNAELFSCANATPEASTKVRFMHDRNTRKTVFFAHNPLDAKGKIKQTIEKYRLPSDRPLTVVVDGSDSMSGSMKAICDCLQKLDFKDATLVWAADEPHLMSRHVSTAGSEWKAAVERLADSACVGGQDNALALKVAVENCRLPAGANIVWVHGPQAVRVGRVNLASFWHPQCRTSSLYEYQVTPGPNELVKSLDSSTGVQVVLHCRGIKADLDVLFSEVAGARDVFTARREFVADSAAENVDAPAYLSHLCDRDCIVSDLAYPDKQEANKKMAENFRIVTPLTSCVVLLNPVPAHSATLSDSPAKAQLPVKAQGPSFIPTKPEPPLSLLMFCALLVSMFLVWRRQIQKRKCL